MFSIRLITGLILQVEYLSVVGQTNITEDIDECCAGLSQCDAATATCLNTVGSYQCACKNGFTELNSTFCTDIDECTINQSRCDFASTICVNTVGSYRCSCIKGYRSWTSTSCTAVEISSDHQIGIVVGSNDQQIGIVVGSTDQQIGIVAGSTAGSFVVILVTTTLLYVFCWKRRKEVNQPETTEPSGSGAADPDNTEIYETLDQTTLETRENETIYTQLNAATRLPVLP